MNYYNDHCPSSAAWLRQLIADGLIPAGRVDERSITEIKAHELSEYIQCHFFAGIGGWPLALAIAGWPASRPVWTGSCPCQPYSIAGKGKGDDDERNLWPAFFNLIKECRPEFVFGEQVADAIGKGWLDGIQSNLEGENYAVGSVVLGAHSVGAPQIRRRLYWVADSENANGWSEQQQESAWRGWSRLAGSCVPCGVADSGSERLGGINEPNGQADEGRPENVIRCAVSGLADSTSGARAQHVGEPGRGPRGQAGPCDSAECRGYHGGLAVADSVGSEAGIPGSIEREAGFSGIANNGGDQQSFGMGNAAGGGLGIVVDTAQPGSSGHSDGSSIDGRLADTDGRHASAERQQCGGKQRLQPQGGGASFWSDAYWLLCRDGKHRRVPTQPALFPLADGLPYKLARRGSIRPALLKGAGNAIVPDVAADFIRAFAMSKLNH